MPGHARMFLHTAFALFGAAASAAFGGRVLPVEAIDASATMRAADFHEAFPGVQASPEVLGVPGFFVVYEHEHLRYFFGPVNAFGEARVWEDRLLAVRSDVIEQRPALASSRVYLYRFNYENSRVWSARHDEKATPPQNGSEVVPPDAVASTQAPEPGDMAEDEPAGTPPRAGEETDRDEDASPTPPASPREENAFWRFIRRVFGLS